MIKAIFNCVLSIQEELNMEQCKIDFTSIPWETPADGVRFKAYKQDGSQVRLVEFTDKLVETDWCKKGHIVYILEGRLEVNFDSNVVVGSYQNIPGLTSKTAF